MKPATEALGRLPADLLHQARAGQVYSQQALKEILLGELAPEAAFRAYCQAIGQQAAYQTKPLRGLHAAAREGALEFVPTQAGGETFPIAPPRVFGAGNHRRLQGHQRAQFLACFGQARLRSRSWAVELDSALLMDADADEAAALDDRLNLDPALFTVHEGLAWVPTLPASARLPDLAEAFSLVGTHSWAFGHWLWEFLPRYLAAQQAGLAPMPVLVDAGMPVQHRQALQSLLPAGASILELPAGTQVQVARLWVAPTPMYMPQFERMNGRFAWDRLAAHPQRFAGLLAEMDRRIAAPAGDAPKLYFARRSHRHRKLLNHEAIEAVARAQDFHVVYPEDLSFLEQVALVRGARQIVGPEGSAFFLAFFARAGARIGILNHPYTLGLPVLTSLLEAIGLEVSVLTGPAQTQNSELPHFLDYRIDPARFGAFLEGSLQA